MTWDAVPEQSWLSSRPFRRPAPIDRGTDLSGLWQGDLPALRRAVAAAPRSQREQWLLRVEINGTAVSPLYWAIRDGQVWRPRNFANVSSLVLGYGF